MHGGRSSGRGRCRSPDRRTVNRMAGSSTCKSRVGCPQTGRCSHSATPLIAHSSRSNGSDDWRIGIGITYIATRAPHIAPTRLSAILARGTDASTISITKPRPRPNSMMPRLPCMPTSQFRYRKAASDVAETAPYSLTVKQGSVFRSAAEGGGPAVLGRPGGSTQQP